MEQILRSAFDPDKSIRTSAEDQLRLSEKSPGFLLALLQISESSSDSNIRIFSLILSKSVIARQWHINYSQFQPGGIPTDEKSLIKSLLIQKIFYSQFNPELISHYIMCLVSISKFDFYSTWPELILYFSEKVKNLNEVDVKVLKCLIKTQISRRTKFREFRAWVLELYPYLRPLWSKAGTVDFDKIIVKCLTVKNDPELVMEILNACKSLLVCQNGEIRLRVLLKGINLVENIFPTMFSGKILQIYLEVNYSIITNIDLNSDHYFSLTRQVVYNLRQILETNDEAQQILKPFSLPLLQKTCNSFKLCPNQEDWQNNDYLSVLTSKKEENSIKKLAVTLLTLYPDLKSFAYSLINSFQTMQFDDLFISLTLISLIPKVNKNTQSENLKPETLLTLAENIVQERFNLKIIWKELLRITRKCLKFVDDFGFIYNKVCWVKDNFAEDLVVLYECCLVAKEMMNYNVGETMRNSIIEVFEPIRFEIKEKIESC